LNKLILKSVLLTTLFFIPQIISQEFDLDKDYLDSLPDEIREDVLKEVNASKRDKEAKRSSRPSSRLTDLEVVRNWEKFLLEDSNSKQSERYGMKLFRGMQSSFMPVNEPNFDGSYILDFGDILEVHIISQKNYVEEVEVKRDGTISIENIGKISVSGLSLETASNLLKSKIETSMIGSKGFISLTSVRDIQVLITGQANFPGIYTLSGGSNLLHALNVSGGISEQGSFRDVEVKRNGKLIESIDLYEVLIYGNASYSTNLQSGDSIYIKPVMNLARTSGAFNNEALFELKDGETLNDLVNFSGGISKDYYSSSLSLSRLIENKYKKITINLDELISYEASNRDTIYASTSRSGTVDIIGQVKNPGKYEISNEDTISSVINRAGGYLPSAYSFGSALYTEKAKELEIDNNDRLYEELIKFLLSSGGGSSAQQSTGLSSYLPLLLYDIKNMEATGRVQSEFDLIEIEDNPSKDTFLSNGDKLVISKFDNSVYVYGSIMNPGALQFSSGYSPLDYINNSGGYTKYAEKQYAVIVAPNGKSELINISSGIFKKISGNSPIDVYPGSIIYVPREMGAIRGINTLSTWAPIVSSVALSIAALNSINNNSNNNNNN